MSIARRPDGVAPFTNRRAAVALLVVGMFIAPPLLAEGPGAKGLQALSELGGIRRALVLGNQSYVKSPLENSRRDAESVAAKLTQLGFLVTLKTDLSNEGINRAVDAYLASIKPGDQSFVFYSGHGIQVENENYLIPVDFQATDESDVKYRAYPLDLMLDKLSRKSLALSVLVLDACRDNPFRATRGGTRGLAQVNAAEGTLITFATAPGKTAMDGKPGGNGVFTESLLKFLDVPSIDVREVFFRTQADVVSVTKKAQWPWVTSSVVGAFCLSGRCEAPKGSMNIVTEPPGASVFLDAIEVGRTPLRKEVEARTYSLRLSLKEHAEVLQQVVIAPGHEENITAKLAARFGILRVETTPAGASLFVDGKEVGKTPVRAELASKKYEIQLARQGFKSLTEVIQIEAGQEAIVLRQLLPRFGSVSIDTAQAGIPVLLGGRPFGVTPLTRELEPGTYAFEASDACNTSVRQTVSIEAGERRSMFLSLVPREVSVTVETSDRNGNALPTIVLVDGRNVGAAPGVLNIASCAKSLEVRGPNGLRAQKALSTGGLGTVPITFSFSDYPPASNVPTMTAPPSNVPTATAPPSNVPTVTAPPSNAPTAAAPPVVSEPSSPPPPAPPQDAASKRFVRFAVRAGLGGQNGVLGIGGQLYVGWFGFGIGTGTYALSLGPSFAIADLTGLGGPYVDLHTVLIHTLIPGYRLPIGAGVGGTVGWDWRFLPWLTIKTGAGIADSMSIERGDVTSHRVGLVFDGSVGLVW